MNFNDLYLRYLQAFKRPKSKAVCFITAFFAFSFFLYGKEIEPTTYGSNKDVTFNSILWKQKGANQPDVTEMKTWHSKNDDIKKKMKWYDDESKKLYGEKKKSLLIQASKELVEYTNKRPISLRQKMLKNLTQEILPNKSKLEMIELLGPSRKTDYFKSLKPDLIYHLGNDRSFIGIDSEWLLIIIDDNGKYLNHKIMTD